MANNFDSNITQKVAPIFLKAFESQRVVTKTVNTQLLAGQFTPEFGSTVGFKRPHDYRSVRTPTGDISALPKNDIISGKALGVVQDYFTIAMEWSELDEAINLNQLEQILKPQAARMVTNLETDFASFIINQCNLHYGTPGTSVSSWADVAGANALMDSVGVPNDDERYYILNPFATSALAEAQGGLSSGDNSLVTTAWQNASLSKRFGNLLAMTSSALGSYTSGSLTDRAGVLSATPDGTYLTHKDTMIQTLAVSGFGAAADTINAGEIITVTARNRLSLSTRQSFVDNTGAQVIWSGVVTEDVTLVGGAGTLLVAGPAMNETDGQYNTVDSALTIGDVINVLGTAATFTQPNMFYHKQAFGIGSVALKKLFSTDTLATSEDGIRIRVSKYSDGDANVQKIRFDMLPAYAVFNPFFAGQGFGV